MPCLVTAGLVIDNFGEETLWSDAAFKTCAYMYIYRLICSAFSARPKVLIFSLFSSHYM